jgi:hypothetical protein
VRRVFFLGCLLLALSSAPALADGDPASDSLFAENVFVPYPPPPAQSTAELTAAVKTVYARGYRIKVAVIATESDLGSVPSLYSKPLEYAQFLGQEIRFYYVGPLLVVMPAGFGIYDGGRSVAAEEAVLGRAKVAGTTADALVRSATTVVQQLLAAGALKSKDIKPPYVQPYDAVGHPGQPLKLRYSVVDDSGRSHVVVDVRIGAKRVASFDVPMREVKGTVAYSVTWRVPKPVPPGLAQVCVRATDPSGNRSAPSCIPIKIQ